MSLPAVTVNNLVVRYGDRVAVDGVSFTAEAGTVTAVLGPNGAGKTSTIEVCEGYRAASSGEVRVLGLDPRTDQRRLAERMGIMLQDGGVYPSARVADVVRLFCDLYGNVENPGDLLARVGLGEQARSTWRRLSGGERQRLSLALALAGRPDVAFLDEPTSGVDVNGRGMIRSIVRELAERGCCVVLATHELDEAEKTADRAIVFDHGRVLASGSLDSLRGTQRHVRVRLADGAPAPDFAELGCPVSRNGDTYTIEGASAESVAAVAALLARQRIEPLELRAGQASLEDVFRRLTEGDPR
ncbi:MAG: ABC transporter ATP-binding protein [Ilumatobacteraceae bacterium]